MATTKADPQAAFRAGLSGRAFGERAAASGLAEEAASFLAGRNEELIVATTRLAGLSEPRAAYETGRVLRAIAKLFDQAGAPPSVGEQFRDNLAAAVITHHMRRTPRHWGAEDTVGMFMEMYRRILGEDESTWPKVRDALLLFAKDDGMELPGGAQRLRNPFRRRPPQIWVGPSEPRERFS